MSAQAQTISYMPLHGNYTQYVYHHQHWDGSQNVESFSKTIWSGDTTINGENYTRIFQGGLYYGGVRENINTQQRYFLNGNNVEYNITIPHSLPVGTVLTDSSVFLNTFRTYLDIYVNPDYDTLKITQVDSILETNGYYSATYHLECLPQPNASFELNTYRGLLGIQGFEFSESQLCYREDGAQTLPGEETPWTYLCDLGISGNSLLDVAISPNPTVDFIEFSGKDLSMIRELALYDLNGTLVKNVGQSEISHRISLEELEIGMYFLVFNGNAKTVRLIKQ